MGDWIGEHRGQVIGGAILVALIVVLLATGQKESLVIGVIAGAAYGLLALGLVLIYKSSGVFNFAQGEFGTVAVYVLYLLHFDVPYGVAAFGALVAAVLMGVLVERLVVRPLFDAPRVTLLVATAGVALLATAIEIWFGEATARPLDRALPTLNRVSVLGVHISDQRLLLIGVLILLAALLALFFRKTNLGLAILGASQEPTATELMGISVRRLSTLVWAIAALLGGIAGVLAIPEGGGFAPGALTVAFLIPAFTAAVLGGMTSLPGRVPRRDHRRHRRSGRDERADLRRHPGLSGHAARLPRAAGRAHRAAAGSPRRAELTMAIDAPRSPATPPTPAPRGAGGDAEPFRPSPLGWVAPRHRVDRARLARARLPAAARGVRGAAVLGGGDLRDHRPVAQRAARLRRPDLARPPGVRRHRRVHRRVHGDGAEPVVLARRRGRGRDRRAAGLDPRRRVAAHHRASTSRSSRSRTGWWRRRTSSRSKISPVAARASPRPSRSGSTRTGATTTSASRSSRSSSGSTGA